VRAAVEIENEVIYETKHVCMAGHIKMANVDLLKQSTEETHGVSNGQSFGNDTTFPEVTT